MVLQKSSSKLAPAYSRIPAAPHPRVIYVLGAAHSGSTVLDIALGAHPQVVAVGELTNLVTHAWQERLYCSCGEVGDVCRFWSEVRKRWNLLCGADDSERYVQLQGQFEHIRSIPRLLWAVRRRHPSFVEYARLTQCLFAAIAQVRGATVVVDSSKNPIRALALTFMQEIDLSIVHLVRDARGVAASFKKSKQFNPRGGIQRTRRPVGVTRSALNWILVNCLSLLMRRISQAPSFLLRYEDYALSAQVVLTTLGRFAGLDLGSIGALLERGGVVRAQHCISGNRLRMRGQIRLTFDDAWTRTLSARENRWVWLLTGGLQRFYGYSRRPARLQGIEETSDIYLGRSLPFSAD